MTDKDRWQQARDKILDNERERHQIGVLSEKSIHAVVKNYIEPDEDCHEIPIEGKVADIYIAPDRIFEIQTRSFNRLREKLDIFLQSYEVTVVYPIANRRRIIWIDPNTGEEKCGDFRKNGNIYSIFEELIRIKSYIPNPHLHITILQMDMTEYRLLTGRSKDRKSFGAKKLDKVPEELISKLTLDSVADYMQFIPIELEDEFTIKEFKSAAKISQEAAQLTVSFLKALGLVRHIGKRGRAYLYRIID